MKSDRQDMLLYIEPSENVSEVPVIDAATRKMTAAFHRATPGIAYRGYHTCRCGANSSNCDYTLADGTQTNSLCIHYLALHRHEVPASQVQKVLSLTCGEEEPTQEQLNIPRHYNQKIGMR